MTMKWGNIPCSREQINKAKELQSSAEKKFNDRKEALWVSTQGWPEVTRVRMCSNQLDKEMKEGKIKHPLPFKMYLRQVIG